MFSIIKKYPSKSVFKPYSLTRRSRQMHLSPLFLSSQLLHWKTLVLLVARFTISILSRNQAGRNPLLSCSIRTLCNSPKSSISIWNLSVWLRSKRSLKLCCSARLPLSPLDPNMVMETLALVPAPNTSPVNTMISYLIGARFLTTDT